MLARTKMMKKVLAMGMTDKPRAEKMLLTVGNLPKIRRTRQHRNRSSRLRGMPIGARPRRDKHTTKTSKMDHGFERNAARQCANMLIKSSTVNKITKIKSRVFKYAYSSAKSYMGSRLEMAVI